MKGRRLFLLTFLALILLLAAACGGLAADDGDNINGGDENGDQLEELAPGQGLSDDGNDQANGPDNGDLGTADKILYVKAAPVGAGDGSSWSNAFGDLQSALEATGGDETFEIWLAAGTYLPTTDHTGDHNPTDPRTKTFQLRNNVAIFGGFPADATDETDVSERDWEKHQTILSGDLNGNGQRDDGDAYHVFYHPVGLVLDETAVLDGVTITGGYANGPDLHSHGGGMLTVGEHHDYSLPVLNNVIITGNEAAERGGGLHNTTSSPRLYGVTVADNKANLGGGISNLNGSPLLFQTSLKDNEAITSGGGMYSTDASYPGLTDTEVSANTANYGGGLASDGQSLAVLENVTVTNNTASMLGGGIYAEDNSAPSMLNVIISGNQAEHTGGGLFFGESYAPLTNVLISGNKAKEGAGMLLRSSYPHLYNVTIAGNEAEINGGGFTTSNEEPSGLITEGPFEIHNSIIWGNKAGEGFANVHHLTAHGMPEFSSSLIQGSGGSGAWDDSTTGWGAPAFGTDAGHNLDADPQFVQPATAPAPTIEGDYPLTSGSPAIDAARSELVDEVTTDLAGKDRTVGPAPDLGAYEYDPAEG